MNTKGKSEEKGKGKSKREKAKSKAIVGIVLAAIMLASVFAVIMPAIAGNNVTNESANDSVGEKAVVASAAGTVTVTRAVDSPSANIANESANFTNILKLQFSASGESANITKLVIEEAGSITAGTTAELTGIGVNYSDSAAPLATGTFSADNGTADLTLSGGYEVPVGTLKDLYVWVNTSAFTVGDTIKLKLTSFNATGLASGQEMTKTGTPVESHVISGVGKLTVANGPADIASRTINAGENTSIVLMQLNFTATIGACTLDSVTLTENGTANGTQDFDAIYLVNDTDADGVWDAGEPIKGTAATTFSADNGTATITGISQSVPLDGSVYMLVVVNTTNQFWSGDTLAVNISSKTHVNTTEEWGVYPDTTPVVSSNTTTGQAKILVTAGSKQPYLSYVAEKERGLVENAQLNFTAVAGEVNITQLTLEQWTTTSWSAASGNTYPKIYIDNDGDGNVTSCDTPLNISAGNFTMDNVTLVSNFTAYNESGCINTSHPDNVTEVTTKWAELANGTKNIWWYNTSLANETVKTVLLNISVNYTDWDGGTSRDFINFSGATFNNSFYGHTWINVSDNFTKGVRKILNMTMMGTGVGNTSINNLTGELVASSCVVNVTLDSNLTIGSVDETTAGQASKNIIIAVNTTSSWTSGNKTKALPNTITKYGNCSNYLAYDNTTGQSTRIYQSNDPTTGTLKEVIAASIPSVSDPLFLVKKGENPPTANVGRGTNLSSVLQLNFSYNGTVSGMSSSTAYIRQIIISTNGTVNESGNVTACLVVDANDDGAVNPGEVPIATAAYTTDNETIKLTPGTPIELKIENPAVASAHKATYKNVLIAINTSSNIVLGNTLQFYMDNSSMDYIADTGLIMVINKTSDKIVGNELTAAGTITTTRTGAVSDGTVSAEVNESYVELMQLKFTAGSTEAVNITSVNITWNGTGSGDDKTSGIGIINDTDADGVWDATDTEQILNASTFTSNMTFLNLSYDGNNITVPAGGSSYALIYVNTSATDIDVNDIIAVNITAAPYLNYTAYGSISNVSIADLQTTAISSATMTAAWSGNVSVAGYNLTDETWVEGAQTNFPVLALNFTAVNETVNISSITLNATGTANESSNVTAKLVVDTAPYGSYESETILDTAAFTADNGTVTLTPSPEIQVTGGSYKNVLVVADISENVQAGEYVKISLNNPSTDYNATGYYSGTRIQDASTTAISNTTWATGNITVSVGTNTTATGPVTAMNTTNVTIMQLNFSATPAMEDVNITGINLTAAGLSSDAHNDTWGVGIYNDKNNNGIIDDGDVELGNSTFGVNHTAVIDFHTNLTINGTASQTWANVTFNNTVVYVNTSDNFNVSDELQIKLVSYNATGVSSGQPLDAFGVPITSNKLTGTGNLTAADGDNDVLDDTYILAGENNSIVVWQLKLTAGTAENITINNITITERGNASGATDIASIYLVNDTDADGTWNMTAGDSGIISNKGTFSEDNGTVILAPTANNTITNGTSINYLLVVNTTATFYDGEELNFSINRSTTNGEQTRLQGIYATGVDSGIIVYNNFMCQYSNGTLGYGSIDVYNTTQPTGPIYNESANLKEVLKLNFSAPRGAINITNITLKENGTATQAGIQNVSVWFDGKCYNSTVSWPANNATLTLNLSHPTTGLGMIVNGTTQEVTIKVNTTANIATGQTIRFEFNRTFGTGYNATCNVSAQAPYSNETGEINNTITVTAAEAAPSQIGLDANWNLISLWLIPDNTSIDVVTADIKDNLYGVYSHDASTGTWKSYFPEDGVSGSSLKTMTAGWGYWVKMNASDTLPVNGSFLPSGMQTPPSYTVYVGWNLIGFHSENTSTNASTYFGTQGTDWRSIFKWNGTTQSYTSVTPTTTLGQGEAYWLAALKSYVIYPM